MELGAGPFGPGAELPGGGPGFDYAHSFPLSPLPRGPQAPLPDLGDSADDVAWRAQEYQIEQHPWCEPPSGRGRWARVLPDRRRALLRERARFLRPTTSEVERRGSAEPRPPRLTIQQRNEEVQQQRREQQAVQRRAEGELARLAQR